MKAERPLTQSNSVRQFQGDPREGHLDICDQRTDSTASSIGPQSATSCFFGPWDSGLAIDPHHSSVNNMDPRECQAFSEYIAEEEFHEQSKIAMQDFALDEADERDRSESCLLELYDIEEADRFNRRALQGYDVIIPGKALSDTTLEETMPTNGL